MGSDDGDTPTRASDPTTGDRSDQKEPYSYVKSRLQRSRAEAANDIKSWATDGMKGHVLLVRNSRMLVANIIAERALDTRLWDLSRERSECLRARDRDRQLFLRHLGMKGDRFREMVARIESRKKIRPGTVHLPVFEKNGLMRHVHEYPRSRTSGVDVTESKRLMVHPLPFMSEGESDKHPGDDEVVLPGAGVEPRSHKEERHSRRNIRSTSAIPAGRGRYESCLPVRDALTADFLRSSDLPQSTSVPPEDENDVDLCPEPGPEVRSRSCCVYSETPKRPATAPECIHVLRVIDDIDSLHLPSRNQRKTKTRTDVILREIFRN